MSRILLLATTTGYQTRAFGEAAERLDVELVFATDRCEQLDDPWQDHAIGIRFHEEERSAAAIVDAAREQPIDGILAVGDRPTVIAARAARALGLPWHPPEAAAIARHKLMTRERLRDAGFPVPWFFTQSLALGEAGPAYPCVVKPLALSGSRGVIRADDDESFAAACRRLSALLRSPDVRVERNPAHDYMLVEGFIPGREYAIEALMHHGTFRVLAIFDKPDPLDGPFFEETIYLTPSSASDAEQHAIISAVAGAAETIGLHHGPIHAECRVNADGVFVLEVAARPIGGICARSLRFTSNPQSPTTHPYTSLEELLLRHALGEDPALWTRESDASGVMMIPIQQRGAFRGVAGLEEAKSIAHITDVRITAKSDQMLVPLPEGASYLGFIFARARNVSDVDTALRAAHGRLRFLIDAELRVLGEGFKVLRSSTLNPEP